NGYWVATDKSGREYTFGENSNSRVGTFYGTFRWALSRIRDPNGNTTTVTYQTASGSRHLYLREVAYNANANSPALGATCTVEFGLEWGERPDVVSSAISGEEIKISRRLETITVRQNGMRVRRYELEYAVSPSTGRSLLRRVKHRGTTDALAWPPLTFEYSEQAPTFMPAVAWPVSPQNPYDPSGYSPGTPFAALIDINGDGLPDWVTSPNSSPYNRFNVQTNTGASFGNLRSWAPVTNECGFGSVEWNTIEGFWIDLLQRKHQLSCLIDINGDLLPDRVLRQYSSPLGEPYSYFQVQTNTAAGFGTLLVWTGVACPTNAPYSGHWMTYPVHATPDGKASICLLADMNGDGLADRVMVSGQDGQMHVQLNNRNGAFSGIKTWAAVGPTTGSYPYSPRCRHVISIFNDATTCAELVDMNGDGLPDRVITNSVQLNNGVDRFLDPVNWNFNGPPEEFNSTKGEYTTQLLDMNGDGLPDRVVSNGDGTYSVYYNTGRAFRSAPVTWTGVDTEGDGTSGWKHLYSWDNWGVKVMFIDMNGDGLLDRVKRSHQPSNKALRVQLSAGPFPDLLIGIDNGIGGTVTITYTNSTQFDNSDGTRPRLPFPVQVVSSVTVDDGIRTAGTTGYKYSGGYYDTVWREFRGFAIVTERDPLGVTNVTYFHQGGGRDLSGQGEYQDSRFKAGFPFRVDTFGNDGLIYKRTLHKVDQVRTDPNGVYFPFVAQTIEIEWDGPLPNAQPRAKARQFEYYVVPDSINASSGNLKKVADLGEVTSVSLTHSFTDLADPPAPVYTHYTYAVIPSNTNILDRPASVTVSADPNGTVVLSQTTNSYFDVTGNLKSRHDLICPGIYAVTSYTYDNYGNVRTVTDPEGVVTTWEYDTATATFPTRKYIGPLGHGLVESYLHDPRSGQLLCMTNMQGLVISNAYDGLLRLTDTLISAAANAAPTLWQKRYQYSLAGILNGLSRNWVRIQKNNPADATNGAHETTVFMDGLGRIVQVQEEAETQTECRLTDIFYNAIGELVAQTYPIFVTNGLQFVVPSTYRTNTYIVYDPIGRLEWFYPVAASTFYAGRLAQTTPLPGDTNSPVDPIRFQYWDGTNPWAVTVTDPRGKVRKYLLDAFGRTNQIIEVTTNGNFVTRLRYDQLGNLTNITDHLGNQISFFYDMRGLRVAMADPNMGFWQWAYDRAGRLKLQTDAKGQQLRFFYNDPAGRLTRREAWTPAGQCVSTNTWHYDSSGGDPAFTVYPGQLFAFTDEHGWQKFSYDVRNRTLKSVRFLTKNGQTYTTQFAYDDADRITRITYPNAGPTITNIYDAGCNLAQVKELGGNNTAFFTAKGFDQFRRLRAISFGNGVQTSNFFYTVSQRLQRITTAKTTNIQHLTYHYDAAGNITAIIDGVYSGAASATMTNIVYDDLNRLVALRTASGAQLTYSYDPVGNMLWNGEGGSSYTYGAIRPHCVRAANGIFYTYDQNGNVANRGGMRLFYDAHNRLAQAVTQTNTISFGYDANGARLWKQNGTNLQVWIGNLYEEKHGTVLFHIYAGERLVCTFDKTGTNVFQYYHPNHLTSTTIQTDQNGNRIQHYEYTAFGRTRYTFSSSAFPVSRRYTSQVLDEDTGLYYYNFRYYDPVLGRFIQP
ncbi:MAG: FG-GAP-like repeat-containing protein, partial [Verrucomicrobiae bacterium]|nr:FG-GAP-like repeat-containing protein [Verrucomicrobiae bacterium]